MLGKKDRWFILFIALFGIGYLVFKNYTPNLSPREITYLDGEQALNLSERSSDKIIVVFYAAWCGHCLQEIPSLVAAEAYFEAQGIEVIFLTDDSAKDIQRIKERFNIPFSMFTLKGSIKSYGVYSIPTSFFYENGKLIHSFSGVLDWNSDQAKTLIDQYFE